MTEAQALFEFIGDKLVDNIDGVAWGKMMTSPAVKAKGKVIFFFHEECMTFKLGKHFVPEENEIKEYSFLSPFKNKPPMTAWFVLPYSEKENWERMALIALKKMTL